MKKILFVTSEFPPLPGGIGNHAVNLASALVAEGNNVEMITDQRSKQLSTDLTFDGTLPFKVTRITRRRFVFLTYIGRIKACVQTVLRMKGATVMASGKFSLWIGAFLAFVFPNAKHIGILHGSELRAGSKLSRSLTRWALTQFDQLVAVSNFTMQLALNINGQLPITVINNGFAPSGHTSIHYPKHKNLSIITVGNVTYRKGQQNVINALPLLKNSFPDVHYHVVGIPTKAAEFKAMADQKNVTKSITFHGALPDAELVVLLTQCKVFFMLSEYLPDGDVEGFGIAVLEANHYGLPAIGSINSGIADAIKDHYSGRLVDPRDTQQILIALIEILDDYDAYSARAKEWSVRFHWNDIVQQYVHLLEKQCQ